MPSFFDQSSFYEKNKSIREQRSQNMEQGTFLKETTKNLGGSNQARSEAEGIKRPIRGQT